jgi:hypothetical protein
VLKRAGEEEKKMRASRGADEALVVIVADMMKKMRMKGAAAVAEAHVEMTPTKKIIIR